MNSHGDAARIRSYVVATTVVVLLLTTVVAPRVGGLAGYDPTALSKSAPFPPSVWLPLAIKSDYGAQGGPVFTGSV